MDVDIDVDVNVDDVDEPSPSRDQLPVGQIEMDVDVDARLPSPFRDLPPEMIAMIFKYFDLQEVQQFRFICKKFNSLILNIPLQELVVKHHADNIREYNGGCPLNSHRWYGTDLFADQRNFISKRDFSTSLQSSPLKEFLTKIQRLKIYDIQHVERPTTPRLKFSSLLTASVHLHNLKHLELGFFKLDNSPNKPNRIRLPLLEVLRIDSISYKSRNPQLKFIIESDNLTTLYFGKFRHQVL